ncbi:methylmalonyl Co-A mutase-associated GTPase MeaB [Halonotius aquaticus]|uniref:Methylmalonyl Co-A mutase-associated GTPase MeaB n=1 Tax=Halonotius aquaticus TaxID=2216978 RepID=A0A3A6QDA3_9EURY|nr:methylmalonyl Co-A mutase-associated GTPase MeaB [Halonotius aquaticus]RJX44781.1 methylmalonyl Co-A mutase-associated GTPase MeaB [Halonotius aquaticus]
MGDDTPQTADDDGDDGDETTDDEPTASLPDELLATRPAAPREQLSATNTALLDDLLDGDQRALARVLTKIEDRTAGARDLLAALYTHAGTTPVLGITGSPGAGKSTLVDKLTDYYRERGEIVGVLAVDPASPYTGGSVLGDRIRMGSTAGDEGVFVRSMSARGRLGGLSMATTDAVTAFEAFGMDRIIIETVGAGQNEVDIVETADTVAVVVQPGSGDDVQLLKAGILEIGDLFVVNKADMDEAAQTVADLEAMVHGAKPTGGVAGHHTADIGPVGHDSDDSETSTTDDNEEPTSWTPTVIETIATTGEGVEEFADAVAAHTTHLDSSAGATSRRHQRAAATLQRLLRSDLSEISERLLDANGGLNVLAAAVAERDIDPYTLVDRLVAPLDSAVASVPVDTDGTDETPDANTNSDGNTPT